MSMNSHVHTELLDNLDSNLDKIALYNSNAQALIHGALAIDERESQNIKLSHLLHMATKELERLEEIILISSLAIQDEEQTHE